MTTVHRISMAVYISLWVKFVRTQNEVQMQTNYTTILRNRSIYTTKSVYYDKLFRRL